MIVIKRKRNEGKTTKLVEILKRTPDAVLLVYNISEAHRIIRVFDLDPKEYRHRVVSWHQSQTHVGTNYPILIDNVDAFVNVITDIAEKIGLKAAQIAKHSGRKKVQEGDIRIAHKQ